MDEMQKQLKKQEELVKDCNKKIDSLQRENGELKARLHGLKHPQENNECGGDSQVDTPVTTSTGYYWRDYSGEIPVDALQGGADSTGKPIYIGQIYASFLIPAKIYSTDRKHAYYELDGKEHFVTKNIKILCSQYPEQFEWIRTNNDDINLITDKHLVSGGYEPGCITYIGRIRSGGEIAVGKALTENHPDSEGLHITIAGRKERHTSFEVLAFNSKLAKIFRAEK